LDPHNSDIRSSFKSEHCCVLIPTYNNSATLKNVIENVSLYTDNIIVVNDGSTDSTEEILRSFPGLDVLSYSPNKGKGIALRKGLKYAYNKGFQYAISIDSDGQHFAEDLFKFIEKLKEEKNSIIIGARNMDQASVPGKSSFGNKFSNFWFKLETGVTAPDTQSGYRLYPLKPLSAINFITRKFEFEIEVLVRASWKGVKISHVPVRVYYAPPAERVSHFRPFKDFTRIFLLNTVLVILAVLYYIPKRLLGDFQKKSFKQVINDYILDGDESNLRKSFSIALGIFIGIVPIWGFQILSVIALAHLLKLNKAIAVLSSNISFYPFVPFILFFSYKTGGLLLGSNEIIFKNEVTREYVRQHLYQYILGSICFATAAAVTSGLVSYVLLSFFRTRSIKAV
jgi:glycosyltransferase involved in cell wall biosynthesis